MTNDLKTKIASIVRNGMFGTPKYLSADEIAQSALQAIHDAGFVVVKCEPPARVLADAMMTAVTAEPSQADWAITGAVLELLPPTGHPDARLVIAEMSRDYRAFVQASQPKTEKT